MVCIYWKSKGLNRTLRNGIMYNQLSVPFLDLSSAITNAVLSHTLSNQYSLIEKMFVLVVYFYILPWILRLDVITIPYTVYTKMKAVNE